MQAALDADGQEKKVPLGYNSVRNCEMWTINLESTVKLEQEPRKLRRTVDWSPMVRKLNTAKDLVTLELPDKM